MARWKKGQSGNPGGKPKEYREVVKLAREKTKMAIKTLEDIAMNGENEGARVRASEALLDRAWGKAIQPTSVEDNAVERADISEYPSSELRRMIAAEEAKGDEAETEH